MKESKRKKLTQGRLKELLNYDPETGVFTWLESRKACKKGERAGNIGPIGYERIQVFRKQYLSHRLAWFYMEGFLPTGIEIDHINKNRADNRWKNLRLVSRQCNAKNCNVSKWNKSGITGVSFDSSRKKWMVQAMVNGVKISGGRFDEKVDAALKRFEIEKEYNFPDCQTTSSAYLYLKDKGKI
jgi:hypothetical protein